MKIRSGFVSNSSSASFVVEIKMEENNRAGRAREWEYILANFYDNLDSFSKESCLEVVRKRLNFLIENRTPKKDADEREKRHFDWQKKDLEGALELIEKSHKDDFVESQKYYKELREKGEKDFWKKLTDKDITEMCIAKSVERKAKAVRKTLTALRWGLTMTDDNYLCVEVGGPCCYNGWEDITMHKELLELVAFLQFMKYDYRTRVISHEGSF